MKLAICDDNREYLNTLEGYLEQMHDERPDYDLFESGEDLLRLYGSGRADYDAIFMDMEMGGLTGIETANRIRKIDERVIIIFVTSHTKYMQESFMCEPFRFLVKPVGMDEFKTVFHDISKKLSKQRKIVALTENKTKIRLFCDDIIYCESQAHWIWIHTKEQTYKICKPLSELYDLLDKEQLFRVHKSFIVNFNYVKSIKGDDIQLYHCESLIPIGRSYKKSVIKEYTNFTERNLYV